MLERSHYAAGILLVAVLSATLFVPETAFALVPAPPTVYMEFESTNVAIGFNCGINLQVHLMSQGPFQAPVNLTVINPPKDLRIYIYPNPVLVPMVGDSYSTITLIPTLNTPTGNYTIQVKATPLPTPYSPKDEHYVVGEGYFNLRIVDSCSKISTLATTNTRSITTTTTTTTSSLKQAANVTTTITLTTNVTSTVTSVTTQLSTTTSAFIREGATIQPAEPTSTTTERVTDPSTYAWAVSATVAAVVLAVVLLIQRRSG